MPESGFWCALPDVTIAVVKNRLFRSPLVWPASTVLAVMAAFVAVNPSLEMPINDDWGYARMAQLFAATGRLQYDSWGSPMVGIHAIWGALFIKIFGFSFTLLRFSTAVTASGCALVCHAICRRLGLSPAMSAFTAMTLMLSPLTIAMTATFMTDLTGLFLVLVLLYGALGCAQAETDARCMVWLFAIVCAGVLACSVRQVLILPAVSVVASVMVLRWRSRRIILASLCALLCVGACAEAMLKWLYSQPGAMHDLLSLPALSWPQAVWSTHMIVFSALTVVALALPILGSALAIPAVWKRAGTIALPVTAIVLAIGCFKPRIVLPPWLGNVVSKYGALPPNIGILGVRPVVFPAEARVIFAVVMYLAASLVAGVAFYALRDRFRAFDWRRLSLPGGPGLTLAVIVLPAAGLYSAAILGRNMADWYVFDRYLLPLIGCLLPALAFLHHSLISPRITRIGWLLLVFSAALGIAMTHDQIAGNRATLAAADRLTAAGIPRTCFSAGYEYDAWTQLVSQGYIAKAKLVFLKQVHPRFWFELCAPAIDPCYYVVLSPQAGLMPSDFKPVRYTTWLSPRQRELSIQRNPQCNTRSCAR